MPSRLFFGDEEWTIHGNVDPDEFRGANRSMGNSIVRSGRTESPEKSGHRHQQLDEEILKLAVQRLEEIPSVFNGN